MVIEDPLKIIEYLRVIKISWFTCLQINHD